jgi:hypothetical protein
LSDPLKGNLLLFCKPLPLEAQQVSTRIEVRRHQRARGATTSQPPARGRGRARGTCKVVPASDASTSQPSARGIEKGTKRKAHKMKSPSELTEVPEEIANTQNAPQ